MNKFNEKIESYYKKYNLTEADLQTGNLITKFLNSLRPSVIAKVFKTQDYLVRLNSNLKSLKNKSKPSYKSAAASYGTKDKQTFELRLVEDYLTDYIQFFNKQKRAPASNEIVLDATIANHPEITSGAIKTDPNDIIKITNQLKNVQRKINLKNDLSGSAFINDGAGNMIFNDTKFVVYTVNYFANQLANGRPPEFSLNDYLTKSEQGIEDLLMSNLTPQAIVSIGKRIFGNDVIFIPQSTIKSISNKFIDKSIKDTLSFLSASAPIVRS